MTKKLTAAALSLASIFLSSCPAREAKAFPSSSFGPGISYGGGPRRSGDYKEREIPLCSKTQINERFLALANPLYAQEKIEDMDTVMKDECKKPDGGDTRSYSLDFLGACRAEMTEKLKDADPLQVGAAVEDCLKSKTAAGAPPASCTPKQFSAFRRALADDQIGPEKLLLMSGACGDDFIAYNVKFLNACRKETSHNYSDSARGTAIAACTVKKEMQENDTQPDHSIEYITLAVAAAIIGVGSSQRKPK